MAGVKIIAQNKQARHDYFIEDTYEAGLELFGTEVKSLRMGKTNLKDSYASMYQGEMYVHGMHISPYEKGNIYNRDPLRPKKLLLHKQEIQKLTALVQQQGYSLIPLQIYLKNGLMKLELAVAKGKKLYDKRQSDAEKSAKREMDRNLKEFNR